MPISPSELAARQQFRLNNILLGQLIVILNNLVVEAHWPAVEVTRALEYVLAEWKRRTRT